MRSGMGSGPEPWEAVLTSRVMAGGAYMALAIPRLVSVEVVELLFPALR
jgi:hypothetical protein